MAQLKIKEHIRCDNGVLSAGEETVSIHSFLWTKSTVYKHISCLWCSPMLDIACDARGVYDYYVS